MSDTDTVTKTVLDTYYTAAGSAVEVVQYTVERAASMDAAAEGSGPFWRCHGCRDCSDRPLSNPLISDPVGIVTAAATGHAANCTR